MNIEEVREHCLSKPRATEDMPFVHQAWHWHKRHWIQIDLSEQIPDDIVRSLINRAYEVVFNKLPKNIRQKINIW